MVSNKLHSFLIQQDEAAHKYIIRMYYMIFVLENRIILIDLLILMNSSLLMTILLFLQAYTQTTNLGIPKIDPNAVAFQTFASKFMKRYQKQAQKQYRKAIFEENKKKVLAQNSITDSTYKLEINQYADLAPQEFIAQYGGLFDYTIQIDQIINEQAELIKLEENDCLCETSKNIKISDLKKNILKNNISVENAYKKAKNQKDKIKKSTMQKINNKQIQIKNKSLKQTENFSLPFSILVSPFQPVPSGRMLQSFSDVDWTLNSGPVIQQGSCGSCYAAATVQSVQALYSIAVFGGFYFKFSIQQIVDCANFGQNGCLGGWLQSSYQFIKTNGVTSHFKYPYTGSSSQTCKFSTGEFKINSYTTIYNDCNQMRNLLNSRPLTAGISGIRLQLYGSGTFDNCVNSAINIDHAILIVGHSAIKGWKIKNSWGTGWGESGYAWITNDPNKNCRLCDIASAPFLQSY